MNEKKKGTCSEFGWPSEFSSLSSIFSSFVLCSQRFAADLLALIIALLWRFWVGLHVSAIETEKEMSGEEEKSRSREGRGGEGRADWRLFSVCTDKYSIEFSHTYRVVAMFFFFQPKENCHIYTTLSSTVMSIYMLSMSQKLQKQLKMLLLFEFH